MSNNQNNPIQTCKCGCFVFDAECKKCVKCGADRENNPQEVPQAKSVEEVQNQRQIAAETIIKREADKCAKETKTRTSWDDQLIEVQYMITGSMIEFSDVENKELKSRIAELEKQNSELREALEEIEVISLDRKQSRIIRMYTISTIAEQALNSKKG